MLAAMLAAFALFTPVADILGKLSSVLVALFNGAGQPNQAQQLDELQQQLSAQSTEIANYSSQILAAISTLDQHVFENAMVDVLADADASAIAIAEWRVAQDPAQRTRALDSSEQALATVIEQYVNNTYPGVSMLPVLARASLGRLAALATFPDARSHTDAVQLQNAAQLLATSTSALDTQIVDGNQVMATRSRRWEALPPGPGHHPPGQWIYTEKVVYIDSGTSQTVYNNSVTSLDAVDLNTLAGPLIAQADVLQTAGIAADRARGQVAAFQALATSITQLLPTFP